MRPEELFERLDAAGLSLQEAVAITDRVVHESYGNSKVANAPAASSALMTLLGGLTAAGAGVFKGVDTMTNAAAKAAPWALLATVGPGYLAGGALANAMDVDSGDVADIQEQELLDELVANTESLKKRSGGA